MGEVPLTIPTSEHARKGSQMSRSAICHQRQIAMFLAILLFGIGTVLAAIGLATRGKSSISLIVFGFFLIGTSFVSIAGIFSLTKISLDNTIGRDNRVTHSALSISAQVNESTQVPPVTPDDQAMDTPSSVTLVIPTAPPSYEESVEAQEIEYNFLA